MQAIIMYVLDTKTIHKFLMHVFITFRKRSMSFSFLKYDDQQIITVIY